MQLDSLLELLEEPRGRSWLFFSLAIAAPIATYTTLWLVGSHSNPPPHDGMLALAAIIGSVVLSISLFAGAAFAAYSAFKKLPKPRPASRLLETLAVAAPFVSVLLAFVFIAGMQLVA